MNNATTRTTCSRLPFQFIREHKPLPHSWPDCKQFHSLEKLREIIIIIISSSNSPYVMFDWPKFYIPFVFFICIICIYICLYLGCSNVPIRICENTNNNSNNNNHFSCWINIFSCRRTLTASRAYPFGRIWHYVLPTVCCCQCAVCIHNSRKKK